MAPSTGADLPDAAGIAELSSFWTGRLQLFGQQSARRAIDFRLRTPIATRQSSLDHRRSRKPNRVAAVVLLMARDDA
jgi:hypothetical protein